MFSTVVSAGSGCMVTAQGTGWNNLQRRFIITGGCCSNLEIEFLAFKVDVSGQKLESSQTRVFV
jgi:hypothetical protein